jgi:hypothetical protein
MKACLYLFALILLLSGAGCGLEGPVPTETKSAPAPVPQQTAQQGGSKPSGAAAPAATGVAATQPAAPVVPSATGAAPAQPVAPAPAPGAAKPSGASAADAKSTGVLEVAHVGMGAKGHDYGGGYIAVVAASYWSTKERLGLMQIPHDMGLYKANNDGKGPKTHEEFMQKIIKDGAIKLPELPPGQKYLYDPATETLMVLKPADPNGP